MINVRVCKKRIAILSKTQIQKGWPEIYIYMKNKMAISAPDHDKANADMTPITNVRLSTVSTGRN